MIAFPAAALGEAPTEQVLPGAGSRLAMRIEPGDVHCYLVSGEGGEFFHVDFEQQGADIALKVVGPDTRTLLEVDNFRRPHGSERLVFVTESAGAHRIEVRLSAKGESGAYALRLAERRMAGAEDRLRARAEEQLALAVGLLAAARPEASRDALRHFEAAAGLFRQTGDGVREAFTLHRRARTFNRQGNLPGAIESYRSALLLLRAPGPEEIDLRGQVLAGLAVACRRDGQVDEALAAADEASRVVAQISNPAVRVEVFNTLGIFYSFLDPQRSVTLHDQGLALAREIGDREGVQTQLSNLAATYSGLNDFHGSLGLLHFLLQEIPAADRSFRGVTHHNIGVAYQHLGEFDEALRSYHEALSLAAETGDVIGELKARSQIGVVLAAQGRHEEALESFARAIKGLEEINFLEDLPTLNSNTGESYAARGARNQAGAHYRRAFELAERLRDLPEQSRALCNLAVLQVREGALEEARATARSAVDLIESARARILSRSLRFSDSIMHRCYETYGDVLMRLHRAAPEKGYHLEALQVSERGRARVLLDALRESGGGSEGRDGVDANLQEREGALRQKLSARLDYQATLLSKAEPPDKVAIVEGEINALLTELDAVEARILAQSPSQAALTRLPAVSVGEIQASLPAGTQLLEYALGEERSYVWVVSSGSVQTQALPGRGEIEELARRFYDTLTARNRKVRFETAGERRARISRADREVPRLASELARMVVPAQKDLTARRLIVVPDGALHYVPFAALMLGPDQAERGTGRFLVSTHEVLNAPSGSVLAVLARADHQAPSKTLAVFADPVFARSDARLRSGAKRQEDPPRPPGSAVAALLRAFQDSGRASGSSLPRLPFTGREARDIMALVPAHERKALLGFDASREAIGPELGRYRYLHFATHGFADSHSPDRSGLLLSLVRPDGRERDGFLGTSEIRRLRLAADLVVLSSYSSGLGKQIHGEGLVGLTQSFLQAGAKRVLVTLWDIQDDSTADVMASLYRGMLQKGLAPAAALRAAQLEAARGQRWSAPYHWAAFVLQGSP